jgi:DMSO reductase family type II enzyme heme b subunit
VFGRGLHRDGHWRVVLQRQLETGNPDDTSFRPGERSFAILAIWNGEQSEVNGKKSLTMMWTPVDLAPTVGGEAE